MIQLILPDQMQTRDVVTETWQLPASFPHFANRTKTLYTHNDMPPVFIAATSG
jgi:hypothetical protein